MKRIIGFIVVTVLFVAGFVFAGDNNPDKQQTSKELKQDKKEISTIKNNLERLNSAIDFWHDANLKGDNKLIRKYENNLALVIEEDLKESYKNMYANQTELYNSQQQFINGRSDKDEMVDNKAELAMIQKSIKAKERILKCIKNSESFGYKLRLLGDYQEILSQELGIKKVELAEDTEK